MKKQSIVTLAILSLMLLFVFSMAGCSGSNGAAGASAPTTGTVSGVVQTSVGSTALAGVSVTSNPAVAGGTATTASDGSYSLSLPGGYYTLTFSKTNFTTGTANVNVANGVNTISNVKMGVSASGNPTVTLSSPNNPGYGQSFTVTANATSNTGGTLSYTWTGATGTGATGSAVSQDFTSSFAGVAAPSTDPGGFVSPFVPEKRFGVLSINPDTRGTKSVSVKVTDGMGGSTTASVSVNSVPVQPGVRQVASGIPVFLNSGTTNTTTWNTVTGTLASGGTITPITLSTTGTSNRYPWFVPSAPGSYVVSAASGSTITLYAGNYAGAITGGGYTTKTVTEANGMWYTWAPSSTQSSMTFTDWPTVTPNSACTGCHKNGGIAPDNFTPWTQTVHATFFARGVENITANGSTCTTCHTAGGSGGTGGYADLSASTVGYSYPTKTTGAWAALVAGYPAIAKVTNIQCENCHGAQTDTNDYTSGTTGHESAGLAGGATATTAARVSYSSDVCGSCHSSGTGHHFFSEWNSLNPDNGMGHSKIAQIDVTGYSGHAQSTNNSCVRCHTAQGFVAYVPQLLSGNAGTIPQTTITWTKDNAVPQTCVTCHDPHSDANDHQLRIADSLPITMGGFGVNGVGKGALCMACHNDRNGIQCASNPTSTGLCANGGALSPTGATFLHEDAATNGALAVAPDASNPDSYLDSMHDASQTEVLMGRDFFFMGGSLPMISKHANVEDTCVGCHMTLNPSTHLSHGTPAVNTHNFYIKDADRSTLCANCHSSSVDGEGLVASVEDGLDRLGEAMSTNLLKRFDGQTVYLNSSATTTAPVSVVISAATTTLTYYDGSFCFGGTFTGSTCSAGSSYKAGLTKITSDQFGVTPIVTPGDRLNKASWNWTMIDRDGSHGIHNPTLVTTVINNSVAAMSTLSK